MQQSTKAELLEEVGRLRHRVVELEKQQQRERSDRGLLDTIPCGILECDAAGVILFSNTTFAKSQGFEQEELVGKSIFELLDNEIERDKLRKHLSCLVSQQQSPTPCFTKYRGKDGGTSDAQVDLTCKRDETGNVIGFFAVTTDRQQTDTSCSKELDLARQYFNLAGEIIIAIDVDEKISLINQQGCQLLELEESEILGKNWFDHFLPDSCREKVRTVFRQLMQGEIALSEYYENDVLTAGGTLKTIAWHNSNLQDDAGGAIGTLSTGVDITVRKENEDAVHKVNKELEQRVEERTAELARMTKQLKALFNALPDIVLVLNSKGDIVNFNSRRKKNLFSSSDLSNDRKISDVLPNEFVGKFEAAVRNVNATKKTETIDYPLMNQGQECWYRARVLPYQPDEVLAIIENINEHKIAEIELKHTHERLSEAQRLAHIGSWDWNIKEGTLWWSDEVYRIFGLKKSDFIPTYELFLETIHPDDRELVNRVVAQTLKYDLPYNIEHRIIRPSGEIRYVHERGALKKNAEGEVLRMHGTVQDISERHETARKTQEYRDSLAHASRLAVMGELMAGISHELNQPLTAIANYSSAMKSLMEQGKDISELVHRIEELSLRSGSIVSKLKAMAEKHTQELTRFNIQDSIRNTLQLIEYEIRQKKIEVKQVNKSKFDVVYADRIQVEQVLSNIFLNAIHAMAESPFPRTLTVTVSPAENSMVLVKISDTGQGVTADFAGQLFTPFASTKKGGLGIGLSLSRTLVEASGGKICYSPNSETGATFDVLLPTRKMMNSDLPQE